jgi:hypothetical protein
MQTYSLKVLGSGLILAACLTGAGNAWQGTPAVSDESVSEKGDKRSQKDKKKLAKEALALTAKIDRLIASQWENAKIQPAPPASDSEFLRRVYLDLVGRIPSVAEARAYYRDDRPDKRNVLIETLLSSVAYANHFANEWQSLLVPDRNADGFSFRSETATWLRKRFAANTGYDKMVIELLAGPDDPARFYSSKRNEPEAIGSATARLFLGVSIDCAQCHDHPFANWKREQFWEFASFFAGLDDDRRELAISGGPKVVQATFLDGSEPKWKFSDSPRQTLANWLTSKKNPFFARAAVNRTWAYFLGVGLVDPVDDLRDDNPASNPELLNEMANDFAEHEFDMKYLIRAITASRAYQLSSIASHASQKDPKLYAKMSIRSLSPEQLYDSLCMATGFREKTRSFSRTQESIRGEIASQFAVQDKRTDAQTSILQALLLMNGKLIEQVTNPEGSGTLAAIVDAPFLNVEQKLETLFLAVLSRPPRSEEVDRYRSYLERSSAQGAFRSAFSDVFWVLLNSPEFTFNH